MNLPNANNNMKQSTAKVFWRYSVNKKRGVVMKKIKSEKIKRNINDMWEQYKRERKAERLEIVTGYLDFGYEVMWY